MPSTATITAFYTFSANTQIKSSEHNANFNNFRGHLIAIDPNTATAAATLTYDLGATDKYWRAGYIGQVNANTVSVSSLVATTAAVTSLAVTNTITSLTVGTLVSTSINATSIVGTTITATTLVSTSINATTIVGTTIQATTLQPTNIVQATTTGIGVSSLINLTSGQIQFPASQNASADANTLDDYEEGTWTPTVSGTGTAGSGSYSVQVGRYIKVGRLVFVHAYITITAHTGTGNLIGGGLPFTSANVTSGNSSFSVGYVNNLTLSANHVLSLYTNPNATTFEFASMIVGGGGAGSVAMDTAFTVLFAGCYLAAN